MRSRTTVAADPRDLDTLRHEAQRQGVSLNHLLEEAVREKATALRSTRRPHVGIAASRDGRSAAETTGEPVALPPS